MMIKKTLGFYLESFRAGDICYTLPSNSVLPCDGVSTESA